MKNTVKKPLKDGGKLESGAHRTWEPPDQLESPGVHSGIEVQITPEQAPVSKPQKRK